MRSSRVLLKTLGVFALGVFFSCAPNSPEPLYPQNRNVGALDFLDVAASTQDSIAEGTYPDSRSGWRVQWSSPTEAEGLNGIYVFGDTIPQSISETRLVSGTGELILDGVSAPLLAKLDPKDTIWEIPSSFFHGKQGRFVRTDTVYWLSVWLRYDRNQAGLPVRLRMHLGDEFTPSLPVIHETIGKTNVSLRFERPKDQTSRFDEKMDGPLQSIVVRWWKGYDSSKSQISSQSIPPSQLSDTARNLELEFGPLDYFTNYSYMLVVTDSAGNSSNTPPRNVVTKDSLAPKLKDSLILSNSKPNQLEASWLAASDTLSSLLTSRPNYHIRSYTILLDGKPVDSILLDSTFVPDGPWPTPEGTRRFQWDGSLWHWTWPNLVPGKRFRIQLVAQDISRNDSSTKDSTMTATGIPGISCPNGYVAVTGAGNLPDFCIEALEHRNKSDGKPVKSVTWLQAQEQCALDNAYLCSDSQWVRACESSPTGEIRSYGSVETGALDDDSLGWLQKTCRLGTGDSSGVAKDAVSDPRCVSGWGVFDMPGNLAEWTRDVYHTAPGSTPRDPKSLAFTGVSDLSKSDSLGTIRGGTWLVLDQSDKTLPSARCRERNYPTFSTRYDTLPDKSLRRAPNPNATSIGVGFRCCRNP